MPLRLDIKKKLSARMFFKFFRVVNFWYRGIQGLLHRGAALGSLSCSCGRSDRVKCVDFHPTEPWTLSALYSGSAVFATIFRPQVDLQDSTSLFFVSCPWSTLMLDFDGHFLFFLARLPHQEM